MAVGKRAGQVVNLLVGGRENDGSDAFGLISRMGGGDGLYVILGGWVLGIEGPASLHEMYHRPTVRFYIQKRYIVKVESITAWVSVDDAQVATGSPAIQ
jgi:hypothetical protein